MNPSSPPLYVARHGTTKPNQEGRFISQSDPPLSRKGRMEASWLAERLAGVSLTEILTSPMRRAMETTEMIVALRRDRPNVRVEPSLVEVQFGAFELLTRRAILGGELAAEFLSWEEGREGGGAELLQAAARRAETVISSLRSNGSTLLVTHGVLARLLLASCVLGLPPTRYRVLRLDLGSYAVIARDEGFFRLARLEAPTPAR